MSIAPWVLLVLFAVGSPRTGVPRPDGVLFDANLIAGTAEVYDGPDDGDPAFDTGAFVARWYERNVDVEDAGLVATASQVAGPWRPRADSPAVDGTVRAGFSTYLDPWFVDVPYVGALAPDADEDWTRDWIYADLDGGATRTDIDPGAPVVLLSGTLAPQTTLQNGFRYEMIGRVTVPAEGSLVIEPGTVITAAPGTGAHLVVARDATIFATGTKAAPIVFTSGAPLGQQSPGDWVGLFVQGKSWTHCPGVVA